MSVCHMCIKCVNYFIHHSILKGGRGDTFCLKNDECVVLTFPVTGTILLILCMFDFALYSAISWMQIGYTFLAENIAQLY